MISALKSSKIFKSLLVFTGLLLLNKANTLAQQLAFRHLTVNDGLSQNSVFAILQSSDGFIWVGTEDGLNRYDGYEFKVFKSEFDKPGSISNNQVNTIIEDKYRNLIAGTAEGISIFNHKLQNFANYRVYPIVNETQSANFVTSLAEGKGAEVFVGTYDGLKLFNTQKRRFINPSYLAELNGKNIQSLYVDRNRKLWISHKNGLKILDLNTRKAVPLPPGIAGIFNDRQITIRVIKEDREGNIWLGTEQAGLFRYNLKQSKTSNFSYQPGNTHGLPVNVVRDLWFRNDGSVWVATRNGLALLDTAKHIFKTYTHEKYNLQSLSHRSVLKLLEDRSGTMWIGTFAGGLNVYHPASFNFTNIGEQMGDLPGLNNGVVSAIVKADQRGALWVGTEGGGLNYISYDRRTYHYYSLGKANQMASENIVKSLALDKKGKLWIGAFDGLYCMETSTKELKKLVLPSDNAFPGRRQIYALIPDKKGLWVGTNGGGLLHLQDGRKPIVYVYKPEDKTGISGNNVTSIIDAGDGGIWIGTLQGLNYLDATGKFKRYVHNSAISQSLTNNNIVSLFIDSRKRLWVGTRGGGLNLLDKPSGHFQSFTEKDGLLNNVIRAINEDHNGHLWISSNTGLTRLSLKTNNNNKVSIKEVKNFTFSDGLLSNQFLSGSSAVMPGGEMLFGGISGITVFLPEKLRNNKHVPTVVFTDFFINNKRAEIGAGGEPLKQDINEPGSIILPYEQAYFTIKFAALNFINSAKNTYAYKLDGFSNDEWHYVGNQRTATYTNLRPGNYEFMVKAANSDGIWGSHITKVKIRVLPPWYKTWWAYLLYTCFIGALLYIFYYFSYKTARLKHQLDFEQMSHEKDQELAQRKFTFFTNISHEIKTPLTLILGPLEKLLNIQAGDYKVQGQLTLMQRNGERLMRLVNQLLDFRKFESGHMKMEVAKGNMVSFVNDVVAAFQGYAMHKQVELKAIAAQKSINVYFDRDKMEKVLFNLISNALKFTSEGGAIYIRVNTNTDQFVIIEIEDNGSGIPADKQALIFEQFEHYNMQGKNQDGTGLGLSFSKALVELHHGVISVYSEPAENGNAGLTVFTIKLPLGKAHFVNEDIVEGYQTGEDVKSYAVTELLAVSERARAKKQALLNKANEKLIMLVVEDNPEVLEFITSDFTGDFVVHTAANGEEGLAEAVKLVPDVIISDVMMPVMTGTEMCMRLKSDQRTSHIPIILLTARAPLAFKIEGLETGADDYITKPFNVRYLEVRVWNLIESRSKLRERYSRELILEPSNIAVTTPDERFLEKTMKFIEDNLAEPTLTVEELSQAVGMSKATLYRKIKALTNQNTNEFIRSVRLKRAAQLLQQRKFNVNEVAYKVGFNNLDYFRKCFKEQFGVTPKDYAGEQRDHVASSVYGSGGPL